MKYRIGHDTMGRVQVPAERRCCAQTGSRTISKSAASAKCRIITAFAYLKGGLRTGKF